MIAKFKYGWRVSLQLTVKGFLPSMKILWISNVLFPDVCKELNLASPVVGGWMYAGAKMLIDGSPNIKLAVASLYSGNTFKSFEDYSITYF